MMIQEGIETCSHVRVLMIVYIVVFWRNKSFDFILRIIAQQNVFCYNNYGTYPRKSSTPLDSYCRSKRLLDHCSKYSIVI